MAIEIGTATVLGMVIQDTHAVEVFATLGDGVSSSSVN